MSQFYQRYVPPSKKSPELSSTSLLPVTEKRKRQPRTTEVSSEGQDTKRRKIGDEPLSAPDTNGIGVETQHRKHVKETKSGTDVLDKYSISRLAKSQNGDVDVVLRKKARYADKSGHTGDTTQDTTPPSQNTNQAGALEAENDLDENNQKHSAVLDKYDKSKRRSQRNTRDGNSKEESKGEASEVAAEVTHGLVPIPQPDAVEPESKQPTFSVLPAWQATSTSVQPSTIKKFDELGLSDKMLHNLKSRGITDTFPIQSTVIPLLTEGDTAYNGDICVSAATGSGKTLAYMIPVVESLRKSKKTGLRAVIVVPTRELVKQVRETCEICAAGSSIQIATAVGSKSLREEQKSLVEEDYIYDPEAFEEEMRAPIDWAAFNLEKILQKAHQRDPAKTTNYVRRTRLKADILITTPGRLVDHLQNTDGFHLDDVKWLVVDEADRLLNESYQDWIDMVVPALQSRRATEKQDKILSYMRIDLPSRIVRKVLLSATMTRDISQLNHIGLKNPKLIVLDSSHDESQSALAGETSTHLEEPKTDPSGKYVLPMSLQETAVIFKEGADKPLLLLQVLRDEVGIESNDREDDETSQSTSQTSSDSGSETSFDSDSDSDEDSDATSSSGESESDSESASNTPSEHSYGAANGKHMPEFHLPQRQAPQLRSLDSVARCLIFTRSTASASRLSRLISIMSPSLAPQIATLTRSTASSSASRKALSSFRSGKTPILIATDRASRGIDVPGLEHVISYDIPGSALTYVHRVGRTARAGRTGNAWTLVEHREGKWFWSEIGGKGDDCTIQRSKKLKKTNMTVDDEDLKKKYDDALQVLESEVRRK